MIGLNHLSYWEKVTFLAKPDFLVIGSGIVGLSAAVLIKERKPDQKVTVLERGFLPTGASTKNAGFACIGSPGEIIDDLEKMSEAVVYGTVERRWKGLIELKRLLGNENIGYKDQISYELFSANNRDMYETCRSKLDELNRNFETITGIKKVFAIDESICRTSGFSDFNCAISTCAEGQIHTGNMMNTLLKKAIETGVIILNGIQVDHIDGQKVSTSAGDFEFGKLLVCTNGFSKKFFPTLDVEPARAQVLMTNEIPGLKFAGNFHYDRGYYYFRNVGNRVLLGGGRNTDLKAENTVDMDITEPIMNHLEGMLRNMILPGTPFEVEHRWAGTMGVGAEKSPIVKAYGQNIYCAVRLGGMGVAIGTLVGKELAELVMKS